MGHAHAKDGRRPTFRNSRNSREAKPLVFEKLAAGSIFGAYANGAFDVAGSLSIASMISLAVRVASSADILQRSELFVKILDQDEFTDPTDRALLDRLNDEPLVIHHKSKGGGGLIIFVHGLGGNRYGEQSTWGNFPEFIYEDASQFDVGLYEYRTLLRRVKFWESVSLSDEARVFAGIIRDVADYQTIFLIGHSMGGLLCMAAIADLINTNQKEALSRIGGLILMATPQTGSQRVLTPLSWLSKDFYALKPHGAFVTGLHIRWRTTTSFSMTSARNPGTSLSPLGRCWAPPTIGSTN